MRKKMIPLGGLLVLATAAPASAQYPQYGPPPAPRVAPDMCGPGFYDATPGGVVFGPNYWLTPCGQPFNGFRPPVAHVGPGGPGGPGYGGGGSPSFPTHPYAHGPRDYFMAEIPDSAHASYGFGVSPATFFGGRGFGAAAIGGSPAPYGP